MHIYVYMHIYTYIHILFHIYSCADMAMYLCMCLYIHTYIHICACVCINACIYTDVKSCFELLSVCIRSSEYLGGTYTRAQRPDYHRLPTRNDIPHLFRGYTRVPHYWACVLSGVANKLKEDVDIFLAVSALKKKPQKHPESMYLGSTTVLGYLEVQICGI